MTYPGTIRYLESFVNYEKKTDYPYEGALKLERVRGLLRAIGNPQGGLRCIHIAGTKGKGSTCAFAANILRAAGFKVGLYTSPHLSDFRERIRILRPGAPDEKLKIKDFEGMISAAELAGLVEKLKPRIDQCNKNSKYGPLTFFEVYTVLAFAYFLQKKVDFAVLETGLGGRLDATNVVYSLVAAITPISYEHTQMLGKTLAKIAKEKAGIIKGQGSVVISAPQKKEAARVIIKKCRLEGAELRQVGQDIKFRIRGLGFDVSGLRSNYPNLKLRLKGRHQVINAAVAIGIMEALEKYGIKIGTAAIKSGLYKTVWPGRCEVVHKRPWVVLDGAQNAASAETIKEAVRRDFPYNKLFLILGISSDKDIPGICRQICPLADKIILTRSSNPRASRIMDMERAIRSIIPESGKDIIRTDNTGEAIDIARALAGKQDLILATGSLFVVGEIRNELNAN